MKAINYLILATCITLITSCNLYDPIGGANADADYIELAQECEHDEDWACAVEQYSKVSNNETKLQRLCKAYASQAGLTITQVVNTLTPAAGTATSELLGTLANALLPWSTAKQTAAENARTNCAAYAAATTSTESGSLLNSLGKILDCATRIAKTDQFLGSSSSDTTCTTAGNNSGRITKADIGGDDTTGAITTSGMCKTDVDECRTDISDASTALGLTTSFSDLSSFLSLIPAALKNANTASDATRAAIKSTISAN